MRIFLFGTGGHAKVVADAVESQGEHRIVGLVSEDGKPVAFPHYAVVASNEDFERKIEAFGVEGAMIGLGQLSHHKVVAEKIGSKLKMVTAVHSTAYVHKSAVLGPGTVVMPGAVVNAGSVIGAHCIINTLASVDHDCVVGDFTHIAPGCHVAGHVRIGRDCFIGIGSAIIDRLTIGDNVLAGAGSVIVEDVESGKKVFGVPAREHS